MISWYVMETIELVSKVKIISAPSLQGAVELAGMGMACLLFFLSFRIQFSGNAGRRRQVSYDVATLLLDPWRNSTPIFGAVAFCRPIMRILGPL